MKMIQRIYDHTRLDRTGNKVIRTKLKVTPQ